MMTFNTKFTYKPTVESKARTITINVGPNLLFTLRSNEGYLSFFQKATRYDPAFGAFAGASHLIRNDNPSTSPEDVRATLDQTRESSDSQSQDQPRESDGPKQTDLDNSGSQVHEIPREPDSIPDVIPFDETDATPVKNKPVNAEFTLEGGHEERHDSPENAAYKRKQQRLLSIHECLGHMSFGRLQLLATKAGHIDKRLANVDFPVCPGCAYGKAHRRPWRHKGIKNRKRLCVASAPPEMLLASTNWSVRPKASSQLTERFLIPSATLARRFSLTTIRILRTPTYNDGTGER
jgi:hypothetical protein